MVENTNDGREYSSDRFGSAALLERFSKNIEKRYSI
jgi:hypothetical protein